MVRRFIFKLGLLLLSYLALGQAGYGELPCSYSAKILHYETATGHFTSEQMKARATHKVDMSGWMRTVDFRGTAVFEVLVAPTGKAMGAKSILEMHPIVAKEVKKAVLQWTFKPVTKDGKPVASLGFMEFYLCNIVCGKEGMSMSLLK